ncbi:MAG: TlpA family protein disulfide reductase [Sphingobacteriales bacterium]|nr:TlpA family protein disulfide reductase [Sphingobacteriales bacterium]
MIKIFTALLFFCLIFPAKGQQVKLISLTELDKRLEGGKDTTYIINFWATWCAPCLKELPHFEKLRKEHGKEKLKILLVSVDFQSKLNSVKTLSKRLNLKNEVFLLNEKNQQEYIDKIDKNWSGALPATLLLNKSKTRGEFYEKEFTYSELLRTYETFK